jgi:hypothetical protein
MSCSSPIKHHFSMLASEEIRAAAAAYRARAASPGDIALAARLEEAAQSAAARESMWQLAGYSAQEKTQLSEFWWRNELAFARTVMSPHRLSAAD